MNTIVIDINDAARDLEGFIRHLCECGGRIVLTDAGIRLAEITPVAQPNSVSTAETQQPPSAADFDFDVDEDMREWGRAS
jgi:hypothetical protein